MFHAAPGVYNRLLSKAFRATVSQLLRQQKELITRKGLYIGETRNSRGLLHSQGEAQLYFTVIMSALQILL